jgi:hypothetical protein
MPCLPAARSRFGRPRKHRRSDGRFGPHWPGEYVRVMHFRHRGRHGRGDARQGDGSLLHHQGTGQGDGAGFVHGARPRRAIRRPAAHRQQPGVGTTVELWLPRAKTDAVSLVRSAERPAAPAPATGLLAVLIVDDDLLVLTGTAALIEDLGHVAIEVPSGPRRSPCSLRARPKST